MKNHFVKLTVLILLIFAANAAAQEKCGLTNAPKLLNLSLGDSTAQVKSVFGKKVKFSAGKKGDVTFFQNYIDKPAPDILHGVRALYLRFLDGRLYQIEVFYEERNDWQTLADFTGNFAADNNFAFDNWQTRPNKVVIDCGNFTVAADKTLNPHLEITDETARAKADAMREK